MDFQLKTINIKKTTSTIILDRLNVNNSDVDLRALAVLLGGYNEFGRNIDLQVHRQNIIAFKDLIEKIGKEI